MSHEDVAAIWSVLAGRQDVDMILREIIGAHSLNVSIARRDSSKLREAYISHVVTLRVIFDLQRTYLQSSPRTTESKSSALPLELLFSAVLHLLDVIVLGCITCCDLSNEEPYSRLTAHTALAGLRTLLLRQKSLTALEYDTLNSRFEEIYERGHWYGAKYTLMLRLCRQAIQKLAGATLEGRYAEPACCTAHLPDFFNGLYLLQGYEKSITDASRTLGSISLQSFTWFGDCLAFYDMFWSTTAALNQLCMVRRSPSALATTPPDATDKADELRDLQLVLSTRYQLRRQAHLSSEAAQGSCLAEQFLSLMLQDIRPDCAEEKCQCFEENSSIIQEMRLRHGTQSSLPQGSDKDFSESLFHSDIRKALQRLHQSLEKRELSLMRPQHQLFVAKVRSQVTMSSASDPARPTTFKRAATLLSNAGSRSEPQKPQSWPPLPHSYSIPSTHDSVSTPTASDAMPIQPVATLTVGSVDATLLRRQPSDLSSRASTSNPETSAGSEVFSFRSPPLSSVDEDPPPLPPSKINSDNLPQVHPGTMLDPPVLERVTLTAATENLPEVYRASSKGRIPYNERSQTWQPDRDNHLEVAPRSLSTAAITMAPSILSKESDGSSSIYPSGTTYMKPKRWQGIFGTSKIGASPSPPSFAFFASGTNLLLWNSIGAGHYDLKDTQLPHFQRVNATGVCAAAGGRKRCAVVVKSISTSTRSWEAVSNNTESEQEYRMEVYEGSCDVAIREWKMESQPHAIAVSRNDKIIAAKFSKFVSIFEVDSGSTFQHQLPKPKSRAGRGNHLVTFATDSLSFVATTRYEPEKVVTYRSECSNASKATVVESSAPTGFPGDNGLSSLICSSSNAQAAFLTTFTEKASPAFLSLRGGSKICARAVPDPKGRIGTRIHHAALCPLGVDLVILNQRNDLFWIEDCWTGVKEPRRVGTVKRSVAVMREVELGMPSSDEVHLFWVDKGKGVLVTMGKGGGKTKPIELLVNLEMLLS